jgi:succinoglycan biosynthesis transport protein ExoP
MNQDSQGATGSEGTQMTEPALGQLAARSGRRERRPGGDASHRPYAVARWSSPTPARRSPRGLFVNHWGWMLLVTALVVTAAALLSWSRTPIYHASADVLVQPRLFAAGTAPQAPDMGSEKAAASSTVVLNIAAQALGVSTNTLAHGVSVSVPLNTHVLHISYDSSDADLARRRAQAVATAYVSYWLAQQPQLAGASARPTSAQILDTAVISPASLPSAPASPNHLVDVTIALIIGLALAGGTAYLRDRLDDRLRGAEEFETNGAGPVLAVVPGTRRSRTDPVVARTPGSPGAEAYRELRTLLLRVAEQRDAKSLLVTSPIGFAQAAISANVAVTLAQTGKRVVLVQADMRRPHGHELFGSDQVPGLADVLEDRASLTSVLRQLEVPGPYLLPAGLLVGDIGTALHPSRLGAVIRQLCADLDFVVIDAPAVMTGSDIATMLEVTDMALMVVEARSTTRAQVHAATNRLAHVRQKLIGCALVNHGGRVRIATPPLELIPSREIHQNSLPANDGGDSDHQTQDQEADESARFLLSRLVETLDASDDGVAQVNGRHVPGTKTKG